MTITHHFLSQAFKGRHFRKSWILPRSCSRCALSTLPSRSAFGEIRRALLKVIILPKDAASPGCAIRNQRIVLDSTRPQEFSDGFFGLLFVNHQLVEGVGIRA
jgi:hypothetical protein